MQRDFRRRISPGSLGVSHRPTGIHRPGDFASASRRYAGTAVPDAPAWILRILAPALIGVFLVQMRSRFTLRHGSMRDLIAVAAILVVLLRALIPAGFMPVAAMGGTHLMFCHGADPQSVRHSGTHGGADSHCSFALSSGGAPAPSSLVSNVTVSPDNWLRARQSISAPRAAPARHSAPRGPPVLA